MEDDIFEFGFELDIKMSEWLKLPLKDRIEIEDSFPETAEEGSVLVIGVGESRKDFDDLKTLVSMLMKFGIKTDSEGNNLKEVLSAVKDELDSTK